MSHSNNQQFLEPGQRVRLTKPILGRVEDLSGVLQVRDMMADTEVIILARETRLEKDTTGKNVEVPYYRFKKDTGEEWIKYLPGADVGKSQLIPHSHLSETKDGPVKGDFHKLRRKPLFVIKPFEYKGEILTIHQGEIYHLRRGDMIFILSDGKDTKEGINRTTELSNAHYHFQKAIATKGPRIWTSQTYHSTSSFRVIYPDEGKERKFGILG